MGILEGNSSKERIDLMRRCQCVAKLKLVLHSKFFFFMSRMLNCKHLIHCNQVLLFVEWRVVVNMKWDL